MSNIAQNGERVENADGLNIFFRSWRPEGTPRGFVVIVPGFNAHSAYYTLGGLTLEMFQLSGPNPEVRVPARLMKGKRDDHTAKLPTVAVEILPEYLAGKETGKPVWPGPWAAERKAAELLRRDMKLAGIHYRVLGPSGETVADFHAIRHTAFSEVSKLDLITAKQFGGHSSIKRRSATRIAARMRWAGV